METRQLDAETKKAVLSFLVLIVGSYDIAGAIVYGSRARGTHGPDSDADVAVLLKGERKSVYTVALAMADLAWDVLTETGINVTPLPIWLDEWEHPETHSNPALLENIRNEGIRLTMKTRQLDTKTEKAVMSFLALIVGSYDIVGAIVYGSRARGTHSPDSDADVAVILNGEHQRFLTTKLAMADLAFDILLETGINISPLPVWLDEWEHPENYSNPFLLENIRNEGIRLPMPKVPAS